MFKRKKWKYLILDEAHMIKNWKSQRWQVGWRLDGQAGVLGCCKTCQHPTWPRRHA